MMENFFRTIQGSVAQDIDRLYYTRGSGVRVPAAVRRRIWLDSGSARRRYLVDSQRLDILWRQERGVVSLAIFIGLVIATKAFATSATNGAGGVGGTFAPSLYVGCLTGFLFAFLVNHFRPRGGTVDQKFRHDRHGRCDERRHARAPYGGHLPHGRAYGGLQLFLPLLIVSTISYGTIKVFGALLDIHHATGQAGAAAHAP